MLALASSVIGALLSLSDVALRVGLVVGCSGPDALSVARIVTLTALARSGVYRGLAELRGAGLLVNLSPIGVAPCYRLVGGADVEAVTVRAVAPVVVIDTPMVFNRLSPFGVCLAALGRDELGNCPPYAAWPVAHGLGYCKANYLAAYNAPRVSGVKLGWEAFASAVASNLAGWSVADCAAALVGCGVRVSEVDALAVMTCRHEVFEAAKLADQIKVSRAHTARAITRAPSLIPSIIRDGDAWVHTVRAARPALVAAPRPALVAAVDYDDLASAAYVAGCLAVDVDAVREEVAGIVSKLSTFARRFVAPAGSKLETVAVHRLIVADVAAALRLRGQLAAA